jgi:hypothetical protein
LVVHVLDSWCDAIPDDADTDVPQVGHPDHPLHDPTHGVVQVFAGQYTSFEVVHDPVPTAAL